jgi:alpha/beta superfamily hydrolase
MSIVREAGFLGPAETPLFGWWHRPELTQLGLGVVLCAPLGHEMPNSWRTQQALADALADAGVPCLRLDWAGEGNSADPPEDPAGGALPVWQAALDAAICQVCALPGVTRVVVLALRAGVLVAAPVAARHPSVHGLVAVAPVVEGRRLVREWRALAATAALPAHHDDGTLEVTGAVFSPATQAALQAVNLAELAWPPDRPVLLVDRADLPTAARWQARLQADGVAMTALPQAGIAEMLQEPHNARVPHGLVAEVADWVARLASSAGAVPSAGPAQRVPLCLRPEAAVTPAVCERVWQLDAAGTRLWGVMSLPRQPAPGGHVLVLPNTGAVHHMGGHRLYVQLSRHLAEAGHVVLRLDLSGLGESPPRPGEDAGVVYGRHAVDDLSAAVQALRGAWPQRQLTVLGLCAGAYHALRLAVREPGPAQCIIVNPLVYHWHEGMTLDGHEPAMQAAYYRAKWRQWESWRRLFTGRSDLRMLAHVATQRAMDGGKSLLKRLTRPGRRPRPDDLQADLRAAVAHGVRLEFVFSSHEPGWPALQAQAGQLLPALQARHVLQVQHLEQADHTLSTASARTRFLALVGGLLDGPGEGPAP